MRIKVRAQKFEEHVKSNDKLKNAFSIQNKKGLIVRYKPNASQRYYRTKKTRRNIILKGRQQGVSKEIDLDQLVDCISRTTNAVVVSHEKEATKRLFAAVRAYIDNLPSDSKPEVSIDSTSEMKFPKRGSTYFIGTAGQKAFGRGDTVHRAHLSEAAFYEDLPRILAGIGEAAEQGTIDIESTPNGRNAFYDLWQKAKSGQSPYTAIFIPWFLHEEYTLDAMEEKDKKGLSVAAQEMFAIPDKEWIWTQEELDLFKRARKYYGVKMTVGQMKWRRYKIWDKGELFYQEYPEDDESCFLQTGRSVFRSIKTDPSRQIPLDRPDLMSQADRDRLLGNKEKGKSKKLLFAAVDPSEGTEDGDPHAFVVIEPEMKSNVATVVFELVSNDPIDVFAGKVADICNKYNIALLVEKNGIGRSMCMRLDDLEVSYDEWITGANNRASMVADLETAYRKHELIESYPEAETEARDMIYDEKNRPDHPSGKHDDRIFARAIALQALRSPQPGYEEF